VAFIEGFLLAACVVTIIGILVAVLTATNWMWG
jgi:hypothetical protein